MRIFCLLLGVLAAWPVAAHASPLNAALILEHEEPSAWTDLLREGFARAVHKYGINGDIIIAPASRNQTGIFEKAADSHDLVIVTSENLFEILRDNAANYRRVMFGAVDAGIRAPNIMCVTFADQEAAFLGGVAAASVASAMKSQNPVVGWLSGMDTPAMRSLFNGFSEGALLAVPGCRIVQAVTGSFTDPEGAAQKTQWLVKNGARVIALASGYGNQGARKIMEAAGIAPIELDAKQSPDAVGIISKSADKAVEEIVASAASGNFGGKQILIYDLANGGVDFTGFEKYLKAHKLPDTVARRYRELRRELLGGAIKLPSFRQRTLCDCLD